MAIAGTLTTVELLALTKQSLGGRNSGLMTDAWYVDRINNAYSRLCTFQGIVMAPAMRRPKFRVIRFHELYDDADYNIVAGAADNFISVPNGTTEGSVVYVDNVYDLTNNRPLDRKSLRYTLDRNPDDFGIPRSWCPTGSRGATGYFVHPRPEDSGDAILVRHRTYNYPQELIATALVVDPIIPPPWHAGIWIAAAAEAAAIIDWPEKSAELEQMFMKFLAERRSPVEEAGAAGGRRHFTVGGL